VNNEFFYFAAATKNDVNDADDAIDFYHPTTYRTILVNRRSHVFRATENEEYCMTEGLKKSRCRFRGRRRFVSNQIFNNKFLPFQQLV